MNRIPSKGSDAVLKQRKTEALIRFSEIKRQIKQIIGSEPLDTYTSIRWVQNPIELTGPRFGACETHPHDKLTLELSEELLTKQPNLLNAVLWREAYLLHIPRLVRFVNEASDLGLYCYYRYALRTKKQRHRFLQIWEITSPPIEYTFYRYYPIAGFPFFDKLVEGTFLQKVKQWFKPFLQLSTTITTRTYTENLERWMFNYQRILRPTELKILRGLNDCLNCSQIELADKLNLRQPTISHVIKRLTEKHLLRLIILENYPILGLQPIAAKFISSSMKIIDDLTRVISKIRYTLGIQEFDEQLLAYFLIPTERMTRFHQWLKQVSSSLNLILPEQRLISERMHTRNFDQYNPQKGGWSIETESITANFAKLISEEWTPHLPSINFYKLVSLHLKKSINIRQEDFIYLQRSTDAYLATKYMKFYESHESRQAGYDESKHMAYRRRVKYLQKNKVISPPLGIGLLNIGLNSIIYLYLDSPIEETRRIFTACQLFPHVSGVLFDDGTGVATLLVPSAFAVSLKTSLNDVFATLDIPAAISIRPAWNAYGWTGPSTVGSVNYDFDNNRWIWAKDTLPIP
jgi:DNA-binding Lrp family transcriptional regulator